VLHDVVLQQRGLLRERRPREVAGERLAQVGDDRAQPGDAGGVGDRPVELEVGGVPRTVDEALDAVLADGLDERARRLPEGLLRLAQPAQLLVVDARGRELRGQALELAADEVGLADVRRRRAADERAAVGEEVDDARGLQLAQRLADRCAADAELRRERLLAQPRPDRELAAQHPAVDPVGERVDQAGVRPADGLLDVVLSRCVHSTHRREIT
jgi:hypothetical protein